MPIPLSGAFLAAALTVRQDHVALRGGCEASDEVVAKVPAGSPVEIRFAMSGAPETCYKVTVTVGSQTLSGYLPASALSGLEEFEEGLRSAPVIEVSHEMQKEVEKIQAIAVSGPANGPVMRASNQLNSKQPREALAIVEAAIKAGSRDPQLLMIAGIAAYQLDDLQHALSYFKEAERMQPDPMVAGWISKIERELQNDKSGEKLLGGRFLLRYEGGTLEPETARIMIGLLDEEFARVSLQLGCQADERIVTIVQSAQAFRGTTGGPEWSGGQYDGKIRVPVLETRQVTPRTRQVFAHEIVHACLANIGTFPAWLHEGMAQKLSGETLPANVAAVVKSALREKKLPPLSAMSGGFAGLSTQNAMIAYAYARVAADAFVERYQAYGIQNVLRSPERLPQVQAELDKFLAQ